MNLVNGTVKNSTEDLLYYALTKYNKANVILLSIKIEIEK